jgi:hypothetical protein
MNRQAYTSTVVAPVQVIIAILLAPAVVVPVGLVGAPAWQLALVAVVIVATGVHLCAVRLTVGRDRLLLGQGPWGRPARVIAATSVWDARGVTLGWSQIFGLGMPFHWRASRLTIRPGPTLCLTLRSGEHIQISTPDPGAARRVLDAAGSDDTPQGRRS